MYYLYNSFVWFNYSSPITTTSTTTTTTTTTTSPITAMNSTENATENATTTTTTEATTEAPTTVTESPLSDTTRYYLGLWTNGEEWFWSDGTIHFFDVDTAVNNITNTSSASGQ